jgi:pimeloyl-ACP methyl ester carboxylesterase
LSGADSERGPGPLSGADSERGPGPLSGADSGGGPGPLSGADSGSSSGPLSGAEIESSAASVMTFETARPSASEHGDGPLVVLIHGAMDRSAGMARTARQLTDVATVLTYDRRGYARSTDLGGPFSLAAHIDDAFALIGDRPCVVFGHSYGGHVALGCAARRRDLVRHVVIYESPRSWESWWYEGRTEASWDASEPEAAAERFLSAMIGRERWLRLPERTRLERRAEGHALVAELSELRRGQPIDPARVHCGVTVGVGSESSQHQQRGTQEFADEYRNATRFVIDGAHHGAHLTHPAELAAVIRQLVTADCS